LLVGIGLDPGGQFAQRHAADGFEGLGQLSRQYGLTVGAKDVDQIVQTFDDAMRRFIKHRDPLGVFKLIKRFATLVRFGWQKAIEQGMRRGKAGGGQGGGERGGARDRYDADAGVVGGGGQYGARVGNRGRAGVRDLGDGFAGLEASDELFGHAALVVFAQADHWGADAEVFQ